MAKKYALLIGITDYEDKRLAQLPAANNDVDDLAKVLLDPKIGAFDEVIIPKDNEKRYDQLRSLIARFFRKPKRDDLVLFYFSGHGLLDDHSLLYLATNNTNRDYLDEFAIDTPHLRQQMDRCHSRRQVLILDCCHAGAFTKGTRGTIGRSVGTKDAFEASGYGRHVLTASDAIQVAWEGDKIITDGTVRNSLFAHFMIAGLRDGTADLNQDGFIDIDELFEYVRRQMFEATTKQTPMKTSYDEKGENLILAANPKPQSVQVQPPALDLNTMMKLYEDFYNAQNWVAAKQILLRIMVLGKVSQHWLEDELIRLEGLIHPHVPNANIVPTKQHVVFPKHVVQSSRKQAPLEVARAFKGTKNSDWIPIFQIFEVQGIEFEMCLVPPGTFRMGSDVNYNDEKPAHLQTITELYWMGVHPVTNAQWHTAVETSNGQVKLPKSAHGYNDKSKANYPVAGVTWYDCVEFLRWLGPEWRLPTEPQWEYAARGLDNLVYPFGNDFDPNLVVYSKNSNSSTVAVGSRPNGASWVGSQDMSGHIWEWTFSIFRPYPYKSNDGRENMRSESSRSLRGGAWNYDSLHMRAAYRGSSHPSRRYDSIGFRCVCPPSI